MYEHDSFLDQLQYLGKLKFNVFSPVNMGRQVRFEFDSYLSLSNEDVVKGILHLAGRSALFHLSPESHAALLEQLHGHFILKGDNWRKLLFNQLYFLLYMVHKVDRA